MSTVLVGLEMHLPFHHPDSLDFLELVMATYRPDTVVCIGDLMDVHANSRHDHDPNGHSAGDELDASLLAAEDVYEMFPVVKFCRGNHDTRIEKAAYRAGIPQRAIKSLEQIYEMPAGWEVADYHIIDDVCMEHGDRFGSGATTHVRAVMSNMRSTVIGHVHTVFGSEYIANRERLLFGAVAGALINPDSYAMAYARQYAKKSILGVTIIRNGKLCLSIPMFLDQHGRFTGEI